MNKIMVVEDEVQYRRLLSLHLRRERYEVVEANDGCEAWQLLLSMKQEEMPGLVLTDIHMPRMGGIELTRRINFEFQPEPPIVIAITEHAQQRDHNDVIEAGCVGLIEKPWERCLLLAIIGALEF